MLVNGFGCNSRMKKQAEKVDVDMKPRERVTDQAVAAANHNAVMERGVEPRELAVGEACIIGSCRVHLAREESRLGEVEERTAAVPGEAWRQDCRRTPAPDYRMPSACKVCQSGIPVTGKPLRC